MLVLTRRKQEAIVIDGTVKVKVLEIRRGSVKIGIEAPADVQVTREEIWLRIHEANNGSDEENGAGKS